MSGVHDDLATLREELNACESAREQPWVAHTALARVEAEIARLESDAELHRIELHHANAKRNAAEAELSRLREDLDAARLLIDMAAWVDEILTKPYRVEERWSDGNDLIRRFAALDQRAGTA